MPLHYSVIQKGFTLKNLPPSESTIVSVTSKKEEIPRRPIGLTRNDKRATALTLMVDNVGEGKMPAFIGLPGARKKTESGRRLFERSEFRSPVGERSGRQEYPITSKRPFFVTSLRQERSYRQLSF